MSKPKRRFIKACFKQRLLLGQRITTMKAVQLFETTRIAEFARQLRADGYNVKCDVKMNPKTGSRYGTYYIPI